MGNAITIQKSTDGRIWLSVQGDSGQSNDEIYHDFLGLDLEDGQNAVVTFDVAKRTYSVQKSREEGWYLTIYTKHSGIRPRHWDGASWCANRATKEQPIADNKITVISKKLEHNENLSKLELRQETI